MKKQFFALAMGLLFWVGSVNAQTVAFDNLNANAGANKQLNFQGLTNYRHRIANVNVGTTRSDLRFQVSKNSSTSFTDVMTITTDGKVGIGTNFSNVFATDFDSYRVFIANGLRTDRIKIDLSDLAGWADHVFEPAYKLRSISEVANFIKMYKHLPDVPSAEELAKKGLDVAEMQKIQMQKIEELTLYIIELQKEIELLKKSKK